MSEPRHIAVEGAVGAGKSTLARRLAEALGAHLLLERPEDNPFLERFYADRERYAMPTQLFFLFQRVEQYREVAQPGIFASRRLVSDFMFDKDALFAKLTLSDDEYRLYALVHSTVAPQVPPPDLVIWLQASAPTLLARIRRRGIRMEQGIERAYVERLADAYGEYFEHHPSLPVLAVDSEALHPAARRADLDRLIARIAGFRGPRETLDPDA